jgi:hypothetical protein
MNKHFSLLGPFVNWCVLNKTLEKIGGDKFGGLGYAKKVIGWESEKKLFIRKDCFQVKSNLLTDFRFTTHMNIMILN